MVKMYYQLKVYCPIVFNKLNLCICQSCCLNTFCRSYKESFLMKLRFRQKINFLLLLKGPKQGANNSNSDHNAIMIMTMIVMKEEGRSINLLLGVN